MVGPIRCDKDAILLKPLTYLHYEDVVQTPKPGARIPSSLRFSEDQSRVFYLFPHDETMTLSLWAYEIMTGHNIEVTEAPGQDGPDTYDEEMRRQRARLSWQGITHYQWQNGQLLVPQHGRLFVGDDSTPLTAVPGVDEVIDPRWSHDGQWIYGVRHGELWRLHPRTGDSLRLSPVAGDGVTYGLAEYAAQEELDRSQGFWLSPDDRFVALTEVDERNVPEYPIVHLEGASVWVETHRYPFVGKENARVRLGIREIDGDSAIRWLDWGPEERYLVDVVWTQRGDVWVLTLARNHQQLSWDLFNQFGVHVTRGYEENHPVWINRPPQSFVLPDGTLVSSSEREGGLRRPLMIPMSGDWRLVEPEGSPDWHIVNLLSIHPESSQVYLTVTRHNALERTLVRCDWVTGAWQDLTPEPGFHVITMAPDGISWVDQHADFDSAPVTRYWSAGHSQVIRNNVVTRVDLGLSRPVLFSLPIDEGAIMLNGLLYVPEGDPPSGGWPLVVSVYAGPHAQTVVNSWDETTDLQAQYLLQHGYCVMKLDSRGSFNRGTQFEQVLYGSFGDVELREQIAGVNFVQKHWPVNPERVGIYGWSYGGYMTLRALLMAPDVFRVGVSGAPVTDFRWYDTAYTERYLATDDTNHAGYESTALLDKADNLRGKLLLIHGMVDENVHFRHSAAMIQAFIKAGKDFDLIVLPGSRHMVQGFENTLYRTRRTLQYFEENL